MKISSITTTALRAEVSEEQLEALDKKVTDFVPAQNESKGCNLWKHMLPLVLEIFPPSTPHKSNKHPHLKSMYMVSCLIVPFEGTAKVIKNA